MNFSTTIILVLYFLNDALARKFRYTGKKTGRLQKKRFIMPVVGDRQVTKAELDSAKSQVSGKKYKVKVTILVSSDVERLFKNRLECKHFLLAIIHMANKRYKRIKSVWSLSIEHESYMFLEDKTNEAQEIGNDTVTWNKFIDFTRKHKIKGDAVILLTTTVDLNAIKNDTIGEFPGESNIVLAYKGFETSIGLVQSIARLIGIHDPVLCNQKDGIRHKYLMSHVSDSLRNAKRMKFKSKGFQWSRCSLIQFTFALRKYESLLLDKGEKVKKSVFLHYPGEYFDNNKTCSIEIRAFDLDGLVKVKWHSCKRVVCYVNDSYIGEHKITITPLDGSSCTTGETESWCVNKRCVSKVSGKPARFHSKYTFNKYKNDLSKFWNLKRVIKNCNSTCASRGRKIVKVCHKIRTRFCRLRRLSCPKKVKGCK